MHKQEAFEALLAACFKARLPLYKVCERARVAQSTTSRWKKKPESITAITMDKLEKALTEIEAEKRPTLCGLCNLPPSKLCGQFGCPMKDEA